MIWFLFLDYIYFVECGHMLRLEDQVWESVLFSRVGPRDGAQSQLTPHVTLCSCDIRSDPIKCISPTPDISVVRC